MHFSGSADWSKMNSLSSKSFPYSALAKEGEELEGTHFEYKSKLRERHRFVHYYHIHFVRADGHSGS